LGFIDSDDSLAFHENVSAKMTFLFPYRTPANIRITFAMKSRFSGNFTKYSFSPYIRVDIPERIIADPRFHHFMFIAHHSDWEIYERYIPEFLSLFIFNPGADIKLEFGIELKESDANCTGMVEVWFDKIEILGERKAFGLLGTTQYGNDVLAQIFWSTHVTIYIAVCTAVLTSIIGLVVGVTAGYAGGALDELLMGVSTFFLIIPVIPVLMVLMALLQGASYTFLIIVLSLLWWPRTARMIRSQVLMEKEKQYVESTRASGASSFYIIFRTLIPNVLTIFFVQFTLTAATAVVVEANLGFFDYLHNFDEWRGTMDSLLFLPINYVSWGRMLGAAYYNGALSGGEWWLYVPAGLCLTLFTLGWVFLGYGLDIALNPKRRLLQQKR
jgi:peptide/nickel transport system permease protein